MTEKSVLLSQEAAKSAVLFDGSWKPAGKRMPSISPGSSTTLGNVGLASEADVENSATTAARAQREWWALPYTARAQVLRRAAALCEAHAGELTAWLVQESGSVAAKAGFEVSITAHALHEAAAMPSQANGLVLPAADGRLSFCRRNPLGVVGVIAPFNFPLYLAMRAVAPALAVGNAVVLKPDVRTAICGGLVIAKLFELAGLPAGVLHVLPGDAEAGSAMCRASKISMIQFTGSTAAGRKVGALAGEHLKKVSLELGGKNTLIVLDDADVEVAASNAAWGGYLHQGQICMSTSRLLVHEKVADQLVKALSEHAAKLPVGDPGEGACALGPLIGEHQARQAKETLDRAVAHGAKLRFGGTVKGKLFSPTILDEVSVDNPAFDEELFAPVIGITRFSSDDEAVHLANASSFGLSAGVISANAGRALELGNRLNTGLLHINDQTVGDHVVNPFGGKGASGNGTSIGGPANWEEFTQWQWVTLKSQATPYSF